MGDISEFKPGWSISRLANEFQMDRRTVSKRIEKSGVAPMGKRGGSNVYQLAAVAPYLVDSVVAGAGDVVDPRDLPPMERRAFYQSENERLKVEVTVGALVPAAEVEADYAALIKLMVQWIDTLPDVLERDCALKPEDLVRVQKSCDNLRQKMYDSAIADDDDDLRDRA